MIHAADFHKRSRTWAGNKADPPTSDLHHVAADQAPGACGSTGVVSLAEATATRANCLNCRWWQRRGRQWGKCGSKRIRQYIDTDDPPVTRDTFQCRFHAPCNVRAEANTESLASGRGTPSTCGS